MLMKLKKGVISQQDFENFLLKSHAPRIFLRRRHIQRRLERRKKLIEKAWSQIPWNVWFVNPFSNDLILVLLNSLVSRIFWILWDTVLIIAWVLFFVLTFSRFSLLATWHFSVNPFQNAELLKLDRLAESVVKQAYSEIPD